MALRAIAGFDYAFTQAQLATGRSIRLLNASTVTGSTVSGRFGGRALKVAPSNISGGRGVGIVCGTEIAAADTAYAGFALRFDEAVGDDYVGGFTQGGDQKVVLGTSPGGFWRVRLTGNDETALAQSSTRFAETGRWYYVEIEFEAAGSGGVFNVYVNGELVLAYSGNTSANGSDIGEFFFGSTGFTGVSSSEMSIDDVYICDSTGSHANARLGDSRVEALRPSATVVNDFTLDGSAPAATAHASVRDASGVDFGITMLTSDTSADVATFTTTDTLSETPRSISGVAVVTIAQKDGAGSPQLEATLLSDATTVTSAAITMLDSFVMDSFVVQLDPDGDVEWTKAAVEATTFGFGIV